MWSRPVLCAVFLLLSSPPSLHLKVLSSSVLLDAPLPLAEETDECDEEDEDLRDLALLPDVLERMENQPEVGVLSRASGA